MKAEERRLPTAWGDLALWETERGLCRLRWPAPPGLPVASGLEALQAFLAGEGPFPGQLPVDLEGQPLFRRTILECLRATLPGETLTYGALALRSGRPGAARAVAQALKANPLPILVPCHRVVGRGWSGGYSFPGGLEAKARLLALEQAILEGHEPPPA